MILALDGGCFCWSGGRVGRADLTGSARLELVSGVVQLRPEDAMFEAMVSGWRAQQAARGLREDTVSDRERVVRRFGGFAGEYPWAWSAGHVDEWSLHLTAEEHLAPSTIRSYQCTLRLFTEFLVDARYGWAAACEEAFGPGRHPVAVCHEWNTIAHLNGYEGSRRRGRSPARSCSGSWTMPMSRLSGRCGPGARVLWPLTVMRRSSR